MALTLSTSFTQNQPDIDTGVVADTTNDYGIGGDQARGDAANYLLWSKTDQNGNRIFDNPAAGNVYAIMAWTVNTLLSGWYERILLRIQNYNTATPYVEQQSSGGIITQYASIVYFYGIVYKCIQASTGNYPDDTPSFWQPVTDLSTLINNPNIEINITDTYVRAHADKCVSDRFAQLSTCGCDNKDNRSTYYLNGLMIAADSAVASGNYNEMERIIREVQSKCQC